MTQDGLDPAHLEEVLESIRRAGDLPRVKLLYLVSYYQNPTGRTTRWEKKARALEILRRYERMAGHPIYLLEDAAYRELRFSGVDVPSALMAAGGPDRVIYTGTYSKPFATGVRVGFGFLPEPVRTTVLRIKGNHDFGSSSLLQHLLAEVLKSGAYASHLTALRARYLRKARVLAAAMCEHFPEDVQWDEPHGGLYIWARLPPKWKSGTRSRLFKSALANNVLYVPGESCYAVDPTRSRPNHEMRISFGGATISDLRLGAERLGKALHQLR
jgi:2-aminoadipate transaminase